MMNTFPVYLKDSLIPSNIAELTNIKETRNQWFSRDSVAEYIKARDRISQLKAEFTDFSGDKIIIGREERISTDEKDQLEKDLRLFMPWRKGPFNIFGIDIDAEWNSHLKWNRIAPHLPDLEGKVVADVGCNNGYYMFKTAHLKPAGVIGFDPTIKYNIIFQGLNAMAGCSNLNFELFGVEHIDLFENCFDVVFLMGIVYHHPSPLEILKKVKKSLKKDGTLIVETQGIPGDQPVALFPEKRYAKVPGTYFVPTANCLKNFTLRAGFKNIEIFHVHLMNNNEQRKTDWMTYESYEDFLDPNDSTLTIEGYPAPVRIYLKATVN